MTAVKILGVIIILGVLKELVTGIILARRARQMRLRYRALRLQSHFAAARQFLMDMAVYGEIDPNSMTFKFLYFVDTFVMRRPDQYPEISSMLRSAKYKQRHTLNFSTFRRESKEWTPQVQHAVRMTADAMIFIITDFSWFWRLVYRIRKRFPEQNPALEIHKELRVRFILERQKKNQVVSTIREIQREMYELAKGPVYHPKPREHRSMSAYTV